jgi:hypothetical protein
MVKLSRCLVTVSPGINMYANSNKRMRAYHARRQELLKQKGTSSELFVPLESLRGYSSGKLSSSHPASVKTGSRTHSPAVVAGTKSYYPCSCCTRPQRRLPECGHPTNRLFPLTFCFFPNAVIWHQVFSQHSACWLISHRMC